MSLDIIAALLYALNCITSSILMIKVRNNSVPSWATMVPSVVGMIVWAVVVRKSKMPVVQLSALYDVLGALAYFAGFALYGEKITPLQWSGISLLVFALYLINK